MITHEEFNFLTEIFNGLSLITVSGRNAVVMGKCLSSMEQFLNAKQQEIIQLNNIMSQSVVTEQPEQIPNKEE